MKWLQLLTKRISITEQNSCTTIVLGLCRHLKAGINAQHFSFVSISTETDFPYQIMYSFHIPLCLALIIWLYYAETVPPVIYVLALRSNSKEKSPVWKCINTKHLINIYLNVSIIQPQPVWNRGPDCNFLP